MVHEDLGFCRYLAPEFTPDANPEEILLEFSDMNLPIAKDQSYLLTRYRAADAARVPLSVVSDQNSWLRHKLKVQERVTKQAVNVMDLYAKRARVERDPCKPDGPEMDEFCKGFDHQPTKDQLRCLTEIENDMIWRKIPMDRLLCGDVGFGKTEVALRAMFRMVRHNKQVALLAPTTILAAQHYRTLLKRMPADVNVALLRGGNSMGSRGIKEAIRNETVRVVVGTHSLLSRKVEFPNLGLLVIDEEQKFGVNQKEKLKVLTTGVDVLTLTATPIPRTLHMSLTGIRDLSTIFSPPANRQNVTTYIMKGTDEIVQRALTREMSRGGQVFYVVPRINQIEDAWLQISRCVPNARVAVGHSKIKNLEDVVLQFTLGRGDILLATSIIENGIDMPNVNSIVVQDSHMFGLSQLYQMRGRVGRSDVAAYTYLLYPPGHQLSNEAKRRLKAMRELSHLGSGFELANRDLEIRGAGNIFGTDQSGDLKDIGYELYMNMLEKAIVSVRGTDIQPVLRCEVDMGFGAELKGSVPADYMTCDDEERERQIDRLRVCNSFRELVRIAKEWVNSYSEMPVAVRRLFKHTHLNTACRLLGISSLSLEFLPERDASLGEADAAGEGGGDAVNGGVGWTGAGARKPMVEDLEAARESHAAQDRAAGVGGDSAAAGGGGSAAATSEGGGVATVNGRPSGGGTPKQVVAVDAAAAAATAPAPAPGGVKSGEPVKLVPFAVMRGPEVEQERWEILFRQGPLEYSQLQRISFRGDVGGVALRGVAGEEEAWLKGDREEWLDHLLSVLLPLVEYVETKQSLQMKSTRAPPPKFVA
ncbi:conserved unknown protein [Ectocarpus siliculosus]|uniref:Transcription-repair coupling factor n=1 Tax=Ectocarpus siliculosus TaxID=2880 RepID=D8LDP5_ECTSI|nr:conserved unknown protein [Ectocarpus siliculosus]|eukprot:CBN78452.1 conserved unknown protein [Ectocarpus siliculosus]